MYELDKTKIGKGITFFSKPVKDVGYSIDLSTATQEQLAAIHAMGFDFVLKVDKK